MERTTTDFESRVEAAWQDPMVWHVIKRLRIDVDRVFTLADAEDMCEQTRALGMLFAARTLDQAKVLHEIFAGAAQRISEIVVEEDDVEMRGALAAHTQKRATILDEFIRRSEEKAA